MYISPKMSWLLMSVLAFAGGCMPHQLSSVECGRQMHALGAAFDDLKVASEHNHGPALDVVFIATNSVKIRPLPWDDEESYKGDDNNPRESKDRRFINWSRDGVDDSCIVFLISTMPDGHRIIGRWELRWDSDQGKWRLLSGSY